jgi:hypothetical protein
LIVLEPGVNIHGEGLLKGRTFLSSVHSLLSIVREAHATTPIAIVSPIFCLAAENTAQGEGLTLVQMRDQPEQVWQPNSCGGKGDIPTDASRNNDLSDRSSQVRSAQMRPMLGAPVAAARRPCHLAIQRDPPARGLAMAAMRKWEAGGAKE